MVRAQALGPLRMLPDFLCLGTNLRDPDSSLGNGHDLAEISE